MYVCVCMHMSVWVCWFRRTFCFVRKSVPICACAFYCAVSYIRTSAFSPLYPSIFACFFARHITACIYMRVCVLYVYYCNLSSLKLHLQCPFHSPLPTERNATQFNSTQLAAPQLSFAHDNCLDLLCSVRGLLAACCYKIGNSPLTF